MDALEDGEVPKEGQISGKKDFETILEDYVGGGGWWQWKKLIWLFPVHVACGIPLLLHMFAAYTPPHRCFVDGCDVPDQPVFHGDFLNFTTPTDHASSTFLREKEDFDPCRTFVAKNHSLTYADQFCRPQQFDRSKTVKCSHYVYDRSEFSSTLTTELDLVCDKSNQRHFLGSIMMLGLMTGSLLGGPISDKIGRKTAVLTAVAVAVPCLIGGGYVANYSGYVFLRYITCTVIVFGWIGSHSFKIEYFTKSKRTFSIAIDNCVGHLCGLTLPLIASFKRDWTAMHICAGIVSAVALPTTYFAVPESSRWLVSNNRAGKAEEILRDIAKGNGKTVSEEGWQEIRNILLITAKESSNSQTSRLTTLDMFRKAHIQRTLILMFNWVSAIVTSYALVLNMNDLAGDIFVNFVLMVMVELPGILLSYFLMDKIGRQPTLVGMMMGQGFFCLTMAWLPKDQTTMVLIVYLLGKCCSSGAATNLWLFTAELYPTNLRSQAVGTCSTISRIFGMSSSFVPELAVIWKPLPMVLLGTPSVLAALCALKLPETKGKALPETMAEAMELNVRSVKSYSKMYSIQE